METLIELNNVSFGYTEEMILNDCNLKISQNDFIGIIGTNGSGKSTLLKLILGVVKPTKGKVYKKEGLTIGYVDQTTTNSDNAFPATVFEVVALGLKKKPMHFITKKDKEKVLSILELFNLKSKKDKSVNSLSGGEEQKVKIARVFLSNPDLIIFDEPTTGIDKESKEVLLEMIRHLHALRKTIILVTHKPDELSLVNDTYEVEGGELRHV